LMIELLPTLGYPINPTLICFLSECNCKRNNSDKLVTPRIHLTSKYHRKISFTTHCHVVEEPFKPKLV
jgi:hypothetical protein